LHGLPNDLLSATIKTIKTEIKMPRGGRRPGAGRRPGQLNKRTIEAVKHMGPVGERAIGVLVSAMEDRSVPWSCRIHAASLVADRAFGRAPQSVSLEVTRRLNDLTLDELRSLRRSLPASSS
jgi:hypothetical protein